MKKIVFIVLIFVTSLSYSQTAEEYFKKAQDKFRINQGSIGAIEDFTIAINLNPKYEEAYYWRGIIKHELGDFQGAIEDFTEAIEINPKSDAYKERGITKNDIHYYLGAI